MRPSVKSRRWFRRKPVPRVRGEIVKLSSFATFQVRSKNERIGRNPKTGEEVPISPRRVMTFKASNVLKQRNLRAHNTRKLKQKTAVPAA